MIFVICRILHEAGVRELDSDKLVRTIHTALEWGMGYLDK